MTSTTKRVLSVSSSPTIRAWVRETIRASARLTLAGEALSLEAALTAAFEVEPDAIVLDLGQGAAGEATIQEIMARCATPIIALVGRRSGGTSGPRALRAGAFEVLTKPSVGGPESSAVIAATLAARLEILVGVRAVSRHPLRAGPGSEAKSSAQSKPTRVLVVDDSATVRAHLAKALAADPEFKLIGAAGDGAQGVAFAERDRPDVIIMDLHMPVLDGVAATRIIMQRCPTKILVHCARADSSSVLNSFAALDAGALAIIEKPNAGNRAAVATWALLDQLREIARRPIPIVAPELDLAPPPRSGHELAFIGIGASTGGPTTVIRVLHQLPTTTPPILLAQHMLKGFTDGLIHWLDQALSLNVHMAESGEQPAPGSVLLAPDGCHLMLSSNGRVLIKRSKADELLAPSADRLFASLARCRPSNTAGVVLTGMGSDGAAGLQTLHAAGGWTLAQQPDGCVVPGMPNSAINRGIVDRILSPEHIARAIIKRCSKS